MPTQSCPPERLQSIAISTSVCVCLSARISPERHAILPMAVARSSPSKATKSQGDGATLGVSSPLRMHCTASDAKREWACTLWAKSDIYDCLVVISFSTTARL